MEGSWGVLARIFGGDYWWIFEAFLRDFSLGSEGISLGFFGETWGGREGVLKGSKRIYQSLDSLLGSLGDSLRIFSKFL